MREPDFRRVLDAAPTPILLLTPDLVIVYANRARLEETATTLEGTVGRHLFDVFPLNPDDPTADGPGNLRASLEQARDTGQPHTMPIQKYDIALPDGSYVERFWSPRNVPILDDDGTVVLLLHRADDITEYVRDRDAGGAEAARRQEWRDRVAQVESDLFARTRELEQRNAELRALTEREQRTARSLAGLARTVSALAAAETRDDLFRLLADHGGPGLSADLLAAALVLPGGSELAVVDGGSVTRRIPAGSASPLAVAAAGRPVLVPSAELAPDAPPPDAGLRAWAALPLRTGERALGSLLVGWRRPHPLEPDDVRVLRAFADQCGQALDRVGRLESERRAARATRSLAETLQRSLLTEPPQLDGLDIAVRYRPAAREAEVGGDWYDAFLSPDGATTLVVGDVTGHDRDAAAVMGQLRNLLRGIAHALDGDPAQVLTVLDQAVADLGVGSLATALVARVERPADDGPLLLRWSNAGHPPPLLLGPDGEVELLGRPRNLLLGVRPGSPRQSHALPLPAGSTVVLYTDGLVERRGATLDDGLDALTAAARDLHRTPVAQICDALLTRTAPDFTDDVALLVLRVAEDAG
ncbi:SpoIIE family protein phosphatase [Blastococcus saxobsidens]|uniref:protein-serine/threonine phosphatase n=1 Tax=Blastococcus saxobsidens TaxID=138336 RepID=A0A6L9W6M6_9ACTN|nr:SpoIIE family protein phosphatase [Blastococcus saxobsidens]NEK87482.1 SpoIIE family protein phosphatase [Blastococcus saxobsidens]